MTMRVMMIAGEASGDLHGSGVVRELKKRMPNVDIFGVGGDKMKSEGLDIVYHISRLSFMGFVEVVKNLSVIKEVEQKLEALLESRRPDVVVLIDYPGFNLRFAKKVKQHNIKVLYYISPQVWAWHKSRVKKMRTLVDRMNVVFPFEVGIYEKEGINVEFVGHPLAERIGSSVSRDEFFQNNGFDSTKKLLGLLPGSRKQEIEKIFPAMVETATRVQKEIGVQLAVGVAPNLDAGFLKSFAHQASAIKFVEHATYDLMAYADAAIVTSGTATLETGWFGTPMAVVYKTSPITYTIGKALVGVPFIGLVNIVAGEKVVPEFVQHEMSVSSLSTEMRKQLTDEAYANGMREKLCMIKAKLGGPGASAKVAEGIIELGESV
ncbi:MAG: lipid-A-disaccharide synthase [Bacteroidota bacterium]